MKNLTPWRACLWLIVLVIGTATAPARSQDWKKFTPPDAKFSVLFPGDPIEQKGSQNTAAGNVKKTTYAVQMTRGEESTLFAVGISEYPESTAGVGEIHRDGVSEEHGNVLVESAANGAIKNFNGQLKGTAIVTAGAHNGKEITLESPTDVVIGQYFWVAPRLYIVQVVTTPEQRSTVDSAIAKFFSSFEVHDEAPPPANLTPPLPDAPPVLSPTPTPEKGSAPGSDSQQH